MFRITYILAVGAFYQASAFAASEKTGLCCEGCNTTQFGPFEGHATWTYNYKLSISDHSTVAWLNSQGVEYVPMMAHRRLFLPDGSSCEFGAVAFKEKKMKRPCTEDQLVEVIEGTRKQMSKPLRYLMGWNEPYDFGNHKAAKKYITPKEAADWWRQIMQPVARRTNLSLVSPTTGAPHKKWNWTQNFLEECWNLKNATPSCDVESIAAFSVHDYKCSEQYWLKSYGNGKKSFQAQLAHAMQGLGGKDWRSYVSSRPIWVTETNCGGDGDLPSGEESCMRITNQRPNLTTENGVIGRGSIATMRDLHTIDRISWWNTWNANEKNRSKTATAMLVDSAGTLLPPGRAIVAELDAAKAQCQRQQWQKYLV